MICRALLFSLFTTSICFNVLAQEDEPGMPGTILPTYVKEMDGIVKHKKVQSAFVFIRNETAKNRELLVRLTEIPSPPFKEAARATEFAQLLRDSGSDSVWIDQEGNVIALKRGKDHSKRVVIDAHLDTVFPENTNVKVQAKGDTLKAPGISDDTRGLVMLLSILRSMNANQIQTESDVLFVGSVGEEGLGDLRGMKYLFAKSDLKIKSFISIDGSDIGGIISKGLGSFRYRVTFKGPGGHSWGAFGLANPQHALGAAIHYFTKTADEYTKTGVKTSYNVGRVGGGTSINAIPFESWMEVDMRSESPERLVAIEKIFTTSIQQALDEQNAMKRSGPNLTVDVVKIGDRPSGTQEETIPLIQRTMAAASIFVDKPRLAVSSTNANIPISKGIPSVTIGIGGKGGKAHSLQEWWIDADGYKAIQFALITLIAEAGLKK
jgi:acetylornithine deacetylase/succinyl-diaminopimelate desuccinylase-like protein